MSKYETQICREASPFYQNDNIFYNNSYRLMDMNSIERMCFLIFSYHNNTYETFCYHNNAYVTFNV